jgi:hypothetical protein
MPDCLADFEHLGRSISSVWREHSFDTDAFPDIAAAAVRDFRCPPDLAYDELALNVSRQHLPPVIHPFSDLSIRVFDSKEFFIELLVWIDGTTVVHEHAFSGAYRVLQGKSIHSRFSFTPAKRVSRRFSIGQTDFLDAELLSRDDVREIRPGPESLHSLFHLERPSVTLVARTHGESWWTPQAEVFRPHVAMDHSLPQDQNVLFAVRTIGTLLQHDEERAKSLLLRFIDDFDLPRAFALCVAFVVYEALYEAARDLLCERFDADDRALVRTSLLTHRQLERYRKLRRVMRDADNLFVIALLSTVPSRDKVEALAEQRLGLDQIYVRLAKILLEVRQEAGFASRLTPESALDVLTMALRHRTKSEFLASLNQAFDPASLSAVGAEVEGLRSQVQNDVVLRCLFDQAPVTLRA